MGILTNLLLCFLTLWLLWGLWQGIQKNPLAFSKQALQSSAYTLGLLALGLIVLIAVCVILLKS